MAYFEAKMHQVWLRLGLSRPLAGFKGLLLREMVPEREKDGNEESRGLLLRDRWEEAGGESSEGKGGKRKEWEKPALYQ